MGYTTPGRGPGPAPLHVAETPAGWRIVPPAGRGIALVADDDPGIRGLVAEWLRGEGWKVLEAEDGATALALGVAAGPELALVISDVEMPGLDGRAVADGLWAVRPGLPVVLMSGGWRPGGDPAPGPRAGARFLPKPFRPADLAAAVAAALSGR